MAIVVYKITNKINGMVYIGITKNLKQRLRGHLSAKDNYYIHNAIHGDGWENFNVDVIDQTMFPEMADELEKKYIAEYDCVSPNGYNLTTGGNYGWKPTAEMIEKNRIAHIGRKLSEEHKKKIGDGCRGKIKPDDARKKISDYWKKKYASGWKREFTPEHREKLGNALRGRKHSQKTKDAIRDWHLGRKKKKHSEDHNRKISESLRAAYRDGRKVHTHKNKRDPQTGRFLKNNI